MRTRCLFATVLVGVLLSSAAQAEVIYITDGDDSRVYRIDLEARTFTSWSTFELAYPIAVTDTVRLGHRDNGPGAEYDLDGAPTGVTWNGGDFISQLLDGTTDASDHNYAVACCDSRAVYRFDRQWGNAERLFDIADETGGRGITYDPVNGTLWVFFFNGSLVQYGLDGEVISSTDALASLTLVGLAYDASSDSFWAYDRESTFYNLDRDADILRTVAIPGLPESNAYGGEIAMSAPAATTLTVTPDPATVARGGTVHVAAQVVAAQEPAPTGTIAISSGSASCTIASSSGTCDLTLSALGAQTITGTFTPANPAAFLGSTAEATVTVTCPAIALAPASLPAGRAGEPYSVAFTATGGIAPYTFAVDGALPPGLTFAGDALSGTPTGEFNGSITVRATESGGACGGEQAYALAIEPPEPPVREHTRYFAEGAIGAFFDTTFTIFNPNDDEVVATLSFGSETGEVVEPHTVPVPAHAQVIVDAETLLPEDWIGFSTTVESDRVLVTTRTQRWDDRHYGSHASIGVPAPETGWWFTEGATGVYSLYYLLYNPNDDKAASVEITYFRRGGQDPVTRSYEVAPLTRRSVFVNAAADGTPDPDLSDTEVSARIVSTNGVPIVTERAMYLTTNDAQPFTAGTVAPAVTTPATLWHFAEGGTDFFDLFLLLANPTEGMVDVTVQYLLPVGDPVVRTYELLPRSRRSIFVDQEDPRLAETQMAITVESDTPIGAERAMWWGVGDVWDAGHVSTGALEPALRWGLSALELGGPDGAEGYVLIANPNEVDAKARVTLVTPEGGTTFSPVTVPLAAGARTALRLVDLFPAARAQVEPVSVLVESTNGQLIVVEGASYASPSGQPLTRGTSTPGLPLP